MNACSSGLAFARQKFSTHQKVLNFIRPILDYDANPKEGGQLISEQVINNQEILHSTESEIVIDRWLINALFYVIKWLPEQISSALGQLEYEAVINLLKQQEKEGVKEYKYLIDGKQVEFSITRLSSEHENDKDLVSGVLENEKENIRRRLGVKGRGGSKGKWTEKRRADFLSLYEAILEKVQDKSPDLPAHVLEKLSLRGEKPSDIAREYAAELYGVPNNDYLPHVLTQARGERDSRGQ